MQPFCLGSWSWLWFVATSLSLTEAAVEQRAVGVKWTVPLCRLRTTKDSAELPTTVKRRKRDGLDMTCVIEPLPAQVAVQVVEVEVWSSVPKNMNLASSLIGILTQQGRGCCRGRSLMSILFLTLFCSKPHLVYP